MALLGICYFFCCLSWLALVCENRMSSCHDPLIFIIVFAVCQLHCCVAQLPHITVLHFFLCLPFILIISLCVFLCSELLILVYSKIFWLELHGFPQQQALFFPQCFSKLSSLSLQQVQYLVEALCCYSWLSWDQNNVAVFQVEIVCLVEDPPHYFFLGAGI